MATRLLRPACGTTPTCSRRRAAAAAALGVVGPLLAGPRRTLAAEELDGDESAGLGLVGAVGAGGAALFALDAAVASVLGKQVADGAPEKAAEALARRLRGERDADSGGGE